MVDLEEDQLNMKCSGVLACGSNTISVATYGFVGSLQVEAERVDREDGESYVVVACGDSLIVSIESKKAMENGISALYKSFMVSILEAARDMEQVFNQVLDHAESKAISLKQFLEGRIPVAFGSSSLGSSASTTLFSFYQDSYEEFKHKVRLACKCLDDSIFEVESSAIWGYNRSENVDELIEGLRAVYQVRQDMLSFYLPDYRVVEVAFGPRFGVNMDQAEYIENVEDLKEQARMALKPVRNHFKLLFSFLEALDRYHSLCRDNMVAKSKLAYVIQGIQRDSDFMENLAEFLSDDHALLGDAMQEKVTNAYMHCFACCEALSKADLPEPRVGFANRGFFQG